MPELHDHLTTALADRYVIERQIGAGGMAVVYLARDVKHDRNVALKVLNPDLGVVLGADRFLSEIRVTANLQHPNLLPLFDSGAANGLLYYVMPYVEGESLRAALTREKQLPVEDALHIAIAIASALDHAHRHGVIHRDLKPENILLHEGQPLVADFGIALAVSNAGGNRITQTGLSLGTPQYMSPEQATGDRVIDGRTDIYSLGAVLYEMLTGEPPHTGNTSQAVIARVLTEKPRRVRSSRPSVPEHVEWAIEHALEKLSADRFTTAREFADALHGRGSHATAAGAVAAAAADAGSPARTHWRAALRHPVVLGVLGAVAAGSGASAWLLSRESRDGMDFPVRFELALPESQGVIGIGGGPTLSFSPDGRLIAYRVISPAGVSKLYLRRADDAVGREIPGTNGVQAFGFSPDSRWIAFQQDDQIRRIEVRGAAAALKVADFSGLAAMIAWGRGAIVVGNLSGGLWTAPEEGGVRTALTIIDSARAETRHRDPVVLADGKTILFAIDRRNGSGTIGLTTIGDGRHVDLGIHGTSPLGVVGGLLIYHSGNGVLLGIPFDVGARRASGPPVPLLDQVAHLNAAFAHASLSHTGSLIYQAGAAAGTDRALIAVDFDGKETPVTAVHRRFQWPRYSPDGRRIVVAVTGVGVGELWIYDIASQTLSPLTRASNASEPHWSPDGKFVVYSSNRRGPWELYRQPVDGSAPAELLQPASSSGQPAQGVVTPDGKYLIYRLGFTTWQDDLWYRAMAGDTASKPFAADTTFVERNPSVSPDGRWVAYASNESGSYQVYVRPFPGPGPRYAVTVAGGDAPVWSRDGRKVFYRVRNRLEEATVTLTPQFSATRRLLFEGNYLGDGWNRGWDLAPNGRSFLVVQPVGAGQKDPLYVVHNWGAEVRARVSESR